MIDQQSFLDTIIAYPDDDAPRLVFADYIDERGDVDRAELIRKQCRLAACDPTDPECEKLKERIDELLHKHKASWDAEIWAGPLPQGITIYYERGFASLKVAPNASNEDIIKVMNAMPFVEKLDLSENYIIDEQHRRIQIDRCSVFTNPASEKIFNLDLSLNNLENYEVETLATSPNLKNLIGLNLHNSKFNDELVALLAESITLKRLTHLDLSRNSITNIGVTRLAHAPILTNLENLNLGFNSMDSSGVIALAGSRYLQNLIQLNLDENHFDNIGLCALARSPFLIKLKTLYTNRYTAPVDFFYTLENACKNLERGSLFSLETYNKRPLAYYILPTRTIPEEHELSVLRERWNRDFIPYLAFFEQRRPM